MSSKMTTATSHTGNQQTDKITFSRWKITQVWQEEISAFMYSHISTFIIINCCKYSYPEGSIFSVITKNNLCSEKGKFSITQEFLFGWYDVIGTTVQHHSPGYDVRLHPPDLLHTGYSHQHHLHKTTENRIFIYKNFKKLFSLAWSISMTAKFKFRQWPSNYRMNEWCFRQRFCTCTTIQGRGQPGLMRWILLWIMTLVQARSLNLSKK